MRDLSISFQYPFNILSISFQSSPCSIVPDSVPLSIHSQDDTIPYHTILYDTIRYDTILTNWSSSSGFGDCCTRLVAYPVRDRSG
jgi:hypothetical protein